MALPLKSKHNVDISNLYDKYTCKVCVNYVLYDKKKKTILKYSSSRPCGINHHKCSIHAEQRALYDISNYKSNNINIFIWRFDNKLNIKPCYSCHSCTVLLKKYGYDKKVFTFEKSKIVSAIISNPGLSLSYKIKHNII